MTSSFLPSDLASASAETLAKIAQARTLDGNPDNQAPSSVSYRNIGEILAERAAQTPEKPFLTYYEDVEVASQSTYSEFDSLVRKLSSAMVNDLGVTPGSRVATLMMNDPRTVAIYFAAWIAGATVVPISVTEDDSRVAFILENSDAIMVFTLADQCERLNALAANASTVRYKIQVGGEPLGGFLTFDQLIQESAPSQNAFHITPLTEALIIYTSGTTGAPKGVVLDQGNLIADAQSIADWHKFGPSDRAMNVLPIHHVNGIVVTLLTPLISGGSIVLNRRFRAHSFWKTLAQEKCTWVSVVPTILAFLCELDRDPRELYDLSELRHIICGAGPLTCELARKFYDKYKVRVVHGYGLSETTCYSCFLPISQSEADYRHWLLECGFPSIGAPISANQMAIHDEQGNNVADDQRGEIVARGHNVMKFYFKRPDANEIAFAHGWFHSGDEGFRRKGADGLYYYFITGRIKELIIRGGVNISPFDIDEVLSQIPGVKAAMAVGFENDFYGEEVGAYVQLEDGAQTTAEEVLAFAHERLPYSKTPKVVVFGETFPVTSTGKYQRNKLKPLFAEWKASEFRQKKN